VAGAPQQILACDAHEKTTVVADTLAGNDLVMAYNGNLYVTAPNGSEKPGKLYLIRPSGEPIEVDKGIKYPNVSIRPGACLPASLKPLLLHQ
jgi:sugar lactone lactonase YvrE